MRTRLTWRLGCAVLLLAAASHAQHADASAPVDEGREIFLKICATCHGETGDGQGVTKLDRPARSFKDGGFSFGDTPEALFRTITSGIPGSPMAAFGEALTEDQRRAVAAHVRSLGPPRQEVSEADTLMVVGNAPVVVRGILPPIVDGARLVPRGLLVGQTDGVTLQYDVDDVRLLGVRFGPFVRRTDWSGRGGTPLEPLGRVVWTDADGDPPQRWLRPASEPSAQPVPYVAQLRGTTQGKLWYRLMPDAQSTEPAFSVFESGRAAAVGSAVGFARNLSLYGTSDKGTASVLLQLDDLPASEHGMHIAPAGHAPVAEGTTRFDFTEPGTHWWVSTRPDGSAVLTGVALPVSHAPQAGVRVAAEVGDTGLAVRVDTRGDESGTPPSAVVEIFTLFAPAWDEALARRLATERPR